MGITRHIILINSEWSDEDVAAISTSVALSTGANVVATWQHTIVLDVHKADYEAVIMAVPALKIGGAPDVEFAYEQPDHRDHAIIPIDLVELFSRGK